MDKNTSPAPKVISLISFIFSVVSLISAISLIITSGVAGKSLGTATAITTGTVVTVTGMILLTAVTWASAIFGSLIGFIMLIVDLVIKRINIIWMPVAAIIIGIASIMITALAY